MEAGFSPNSANSLKFNLAPRNRKAKGYGGDDTVGNSYSSEPMADKSPSPPELEVTAVEVCAISLPAGMSGYTAAVEMPAYPMSIGHIGSRILAFIGIRSSKHIQTSSQSANIRCNHAGLAINIT